MAIREIHEERVRHLNDEGVRDDDYILYWMQQPQRAEYNHALEYAVQKANELVSRSSCRSPSGTVMHQPLQTDRSPS